MLKAEPEGRSGLGLAALEAEIVSCRRCPRLVEWREKVARERRAATTRDDLRLERSES
ncbi:MAG TPA: hypothetical protein VG127_01970 [Rubrobacteraceae bacterium]|nr:hypothetical protein [Rubrobacteraceae bacterium]